MNGDIILRVLSSDKSTFSIFFVSVSFILLLLTLVFEISLAFKIWSLNNGVIKSNLLLPSYFFGSFAVCFVPLFVRSAAVRQGQKSDRINSDR